jgi:hypothetical protein
MKRGGTVRIAVAATLGFYIALLWPSLSIQSVNWRESDVLMVGRNLCRDEATLWLPRINQAGDGPGITGMEFPLLNQLGAAIACAGPQQVVAARVLSLFFGILAILCFAILAARHFRREGAYIALAGFAFSPIVFYYGRIVQPDIPSLAMALLALTLFDASVWPGRATQWLPYFGSAAAMALGALIKIPVLVYGLPMVALLWTRRGREAVRDWRYWLYLPIALAPPLVWYLHARALQDLYGVRYFFLGASAQSLLQSWVDPSFYKRIFLQRMFDSYACPLLSALALGYLALRWRRVPAWMRWMALSAVIFFFLGGESAAWHTCYGLIAVPPLALIAGSAAQDLLTRVPHWKWAVLLLSCALVAGYGVWRTSHWFASTESSLPFQDAKRSLDSRLAQQDRILVISDGDPKLLWYLDRKGWLRNSNVIEWLKEIGDRRPPAVAIDRTRPRRPMQAGDPLAAFGYSEIFRDEETVEIWARGP